MNQSKHTIHLPHLAILHLNGTNVHEMLQGQLSCDIREITTTSMRTGALCTPKGRISALIDIVLWNDAWHLILPQHAVELVRTLFKPILQLARVTLEPMQNVSLYGCYNQDNTMLNQQAISTNMYYCYRITLTQSIIIQHTTAQCMSHDKISYDQWHAHELKHQRFTLYPHTSNVFLPHDLNLQNSNIISFTKGCYKGQEIIARMQYRGTIKYECITAILHTTITAPQPGDLIFNPHNPTECIGALVDIAPLTTNQWIINAKIHKQHPDKLCFTHDAKQALEYQILTHCQSLEHLQFP